MAKKKKGRSRQMLSPEKYIKTKARNLEITECWINEDWEETKMANVFVVRSHTTGNHTVGIYLVDLDCLGVKDAFYMFNIPDSDLRQHLTEIGGDQPLISISYALAHNIVYSGLEFADQYGFRPHKYFSVARYILEPDDLNTEFIDITCGIDNKPAYIRSPEDSDGYVQKIMRQLDKTAGPGNYHYYIDDDHNNWDIPDFDPDTDFDTEDETIPEDPEAEDFSNQLRKFSTSTREEKNEILEDLINTVQPETSEESQKDLSYLMKDLIEESVDDSKLNYYLDEFFTEIEPYETINEVFDEFIGEPVAEKDRQEVTKRFHKVMSTYYDKPAKCLKRVNKLPGRFKKLPVFKFIELNVMKAIDLDKYYQLIEEYLAEHPGYPSFRIFEMTKHLDFNKDNNLKFEDIHPDSFFGDRKTIHPLEMETYVHMLIKYGISKKDITWLEAIKIFMEQEIEDYDNSLEMPIVLSIFQTGILLGENMG